MPGRFIVVGGLNVVLVSTYRQRHRANEGTVREFRATVEVLLLGALGLDGQLTIADHNVDVLVGVDPGKLRAYLVAPLFHLVFQPHQPGVEGGPESGE